MWLIYSLATVLAFGLLIVVQRSISINSKNFLAGSFAFNVVSALIATAMFALTSGLRMAVWPTNGRAYVFLAIGVVAYGLFERLRFKAASGVQASELAVIGNVAIIVSFMGSVWLYHEALSWTKVLGTVLVITAIILVSWQAKTKIIRKEALIVVAAQAIQGVALAVDKMGAQYFRPELYNIMLWTLPLLVIFFPYIKPKDILNELKIGSWKIGVLAILNVFGYFVFLKALVLAEATRVIPIIQTSSLAAVILGIILLKERDRLARKFSAVGIALAGVYLLVR